MTKAVCIIPARGGSVRIPRKNIAPFHGKPMLQRAIELARATRLFDGVIVSTDDSEMQACAYEHDALVHLRRGTDDGSRGTQEIAREALSTVYGQPFPITCVLYPCTPLLTWQELVKGYRWLLSPVAGKHVYAMSVGADGKDAGGFYWGWTQAFIEQIPLEGSTTGVYVLNHFDINTPDDIERAERRYAELHP